MQFWCNLYYINLGNLSKHIVVRTVILSHQEFNVTWEVMHWEMGKSSAIMSGVAGGLLMVWDESIAASR